MAWSEKAAQKRREYDETAEHYIVRVWGLISTPTDTTNVPVEGDFLSGDGTELAHYVCRRVTQFPRRKGGPDGVLVCVEYAALKAAVTLAGTPASAAPPDKYLVRKSGRRRGQRFRERRYLSWAIPQDEILKYEGYWEYSTATIVTDADATGAGGPPIVVTPTVDSFTQYHVGLQMLVAGESTNRAIIDYTAGAPATLTVSGAAFANKAVTVFGPKYYPGESGILALRLEDFDLDPEYPGTPKKSLLRCVYKTPSRKDLQAENLGLGTLKVRALGNQIKLLKEVTGDTPGIIEGYDNSGANKDREWVVVNGSNLTYEPGFMEYILTVALANAQLSTWEAWVQKVNTLAMPNFGLGTAFIDIGVLMFTGLELVAELPLASTFLAELHFVRDSGHINAAGDAWIREPWHCYTQQHWRTVMKVDVRGTHGRKLDSGVDVARFACTIPVNDGATPAVDTAPVARDVTRGTQDFSDFDDMLGWYL